jgi:hypothetical protein
VNIVVASSGLMHAGFVGLCLRHCPVAIGAIYPLRAPFMLQADLSGIEAVQGDAQLIQDARAMVTEQAEASGSHQTHTCTNL